VAGTGQPAMSGAAKAWVNFNGTGTVAIRGSFNVTSITDNGLGDYTVVFTTAMADANYSTVLGLDRGAANYLMSSIVSQNSANVNVKSTQTTTTGVDTTTFCVTIFR
jgi:hypothetical protein